LIHAASAYGSAFWRHIVDSVQEVMTIMEERTGVIHAYFEAKTQWEADIDPADLEELADGGVLRLGQVTGDLAELLEVNGYEIDGPVITIVQVDWPQNGNDAEETDA
jgi:hypothetical protein